MSRRAEVVWAVALLVALTVVGLLFMSPKREASSSSLSAHARGWLAARRYLEHRGVTVELADVPLAKLAERGGAPVWVLAFPWQAFLEDGELEAILAHLRAGGTVVAAYSEKLDQYEELEVLETLGLKPVTVRDAAPLGPWKWWRYQREDWDLDPGDGWSGSPGTQPPGIRLPATRKLPEAPDDASVFYFHTRAVPAGAEAPAVFSYRRHAGRVVVMPAAVLSNAYLLREGHADFLESLRRWLGDEWAFDEYHHGLVNAELAAERGSTFAWDLFMLHLAVFYVLGLLATARRFGPVWREKGVITGSTSVFLRNLGALHGRLGHYQAAGRLLAERTRELDPTRPEIPVPEILNGGALVDFARRLTLTPGRKAE